MDEALSELAEYVAAAFPGEVAATEVAFHELVVAVDRESIVKVLTFLRDDANCGFRVLVDICGVDWPERETRFDVVYNLLSLTHNQRIRVKVQTDERHPLPSVAGVFRSAGWYETRSLGHVRHHVFPDTPTCAAC